MELLTLLSKPSREFTPIPFWFLNGNLTHDEIRRQLNDFNAHGVSFPKNTFPTSARRSRKPLR